MKPLKILIALFIGFNSIAQDRQRDLKVKVHNIRELKGSLKLAIYDGQDQFLKNALTWGNTTIIGNTASFTFHDLKEGVYAVSIFQDENDNGKLDVNFIGVPLEPYAFSNNAKGRFGPPEFKECQIELIGENKEIIISL